MTSMEDLMIAEYKFNKAFRVLLPLFSTALLLTINYLKGTEGILEITTSVIFILCINFSELFYICYKKQSLVHGIPSMLLLLIAHLAPIGVLYLQDEWSFILILLISSFILVKCGDITIALINLLGVFLFEVLYFNTFISTNYIYFISILSTCILISCINSRASMAYAAESAIALYIILLLVSNKFVIDEIFNVFNSVFALLILAAILVSDRIQAQAKVEAPKKVQVINPDPIEDDVLTDDIAPINEAIPTTLELEKANPIELPDTIEEIQTDTFEDVQTDTFEDVQPDTFEDVQTDSLEVQTDILELNQANLDELNSMSEEIAVLKKSLEEKTNELNNLQNEFQQYYDNSCYTIKYLTSDNSEYIKALKKQVPKIYKHCLDVAEFSSEAAELINCKYDYAYAIAIYHEAKRLFPSNYEEVLENRYHLPKFLINDISKLYLKNPNTPMNRETGIVLLADDIYKTIKYLKTKKNTKISINKVVNNTIKVRKEQNFLHLCGFSNEEVQLLKLYFIDKGGEYDTTD